MSTPAIKRILDDIERLEGRLERLVRFGEDEYDDETVLLYKHKGYMFRESTPRMLTYVAIKAGGKWWISNGVNTPYSWEELVTFMADSPEVWVATEWGQVL